MRMRGMPHSLPNAPRQKEDRDDIAFWEQQKKECLQLNPTHHQMIAEMEAEADTAFDEDVHVEDAV